MKTITSIVSVLLVIGCFCGCSKTEATKYEANWESLDGYPVPAWFDDAKFGIFRM